MLVRCPECQGKVSDTIRQCPHCGYMFPHDAALEKYYDEEKEKESSSGGFSIFSMIRDFLIFVLILVILTVGGTFMLVRLNMFSVRATLRSIAESDSGTGSEIDRSEARLMTKFYLARFLDFAEGKKSEPAAEPVKQEPPVPEQNPETEPVSAEP